MQILVLERKANFPNGINQADSHVSNREMMKTCVIVANFFITGALVYWYTGDIKEIDPRQVRLIAGAVSGALGGLATYYLSQNYCSHPKQQDVFTSWPRQKAKKLQLEEWVRDVTRSPDVTEGSTKPSESPSREKQSNQANELETNVQNVNLISSKNPRPPRTNLNRSNFKSPTMKSSEERKTQAIENAKKEIVIKKQLVAYLELAALQSTKEYKAYINTKITVEMYENKVSEQNEVYKNVSLQKLEETIDGIERQLGEIGTKQAVSIMQDGTLKEYSIPVAKETLQAWRQIFEEIKNNQTSLQKYLALKVEKGKSELLHEGMNFTCDEIEKRVQEMQNLLVKEIESNEGKLDLKTQKGLLANLENKLNNLEGKTVKKTPSLRGKEPSTKPSKTKSPSVQELQGGLAALAQNKAREMKDALPSLFKI